MIGGYELYATATLDHDVLGPGLSEWIARRWNAFSIAASSATAVSLAFIAHVIVFGWDACWATISFLMVAFLACSAKAPWRETMGMLRFQALRNPRSSAVSSP
jgi:hypothetical protein